MTDALAREVVRTCWLTDPSPRGTSFAEYAATQVYLDTVRYVEAVLFSVSMGRCEPKEGGIRADLRE